MIGELATDDHGLSVGPCVASMRDPERRHLPFHFGLPCGSAVVAGFGRSPWSCASLPYIWILPATLPVSVGAGPVARSPATQTGGGPPSKIGWAQTLGGSQVRTRLTAGGNRIRTIGAAEALGIVVVSVLVRADFFVGGESSRGDMSPRQHRNVCRRCPYL